MGEQQVDVDYVLTRKDLGRLGRHAARTNRYRHDILFLVAVGAGFTSVWPTGQDTGVQWPALVSLLAWAAYVLTLSRTFASNTVGQPYRASFTEIGVTFREAEASSTWRWSAFGRVDEAGDHFFILMADRVRGWVLPKRCFTSDDDIERVRRWAAEARDEVATPVAG